MRRKKTHLLHLLVGLLFLGIFIYIVLRIDPSKGIAIGNLMIPPFIVFCLTFFLSLLFLGWGLFNNIRRGLLLGITLLIILVLRMTGFKDLLYVFIPLIIASLVEILFWKKS